MFHRYSRRAGLTVNPFVFLLLLLLIALVAWQGWQLLEAAAGGSPSAYATGKKVGIVVGCAVGVLIATAVAGGVGAGLYFMTGKSEFAANAGIGVVLLLACGVYGFSNYLIATRPTQPQQSNAATQPSPFASAPLRNESQEALAAQQRALREQMERTRQLALDGGAGTPAPAGRPISPGAGSPGSPAAPTQPASPSRLVAPPAPSAEEEQTAQLALAPLEKELRDRVEAFLSDASTLSAALNAPPRALRSELEARLSSTRALKGKAAELEAFLRSVDSMAEAALKGSGLDTGGQIRQRVAFSQSVRAFDMANACDVYRRLFDAGLEETQALSENAGKWRTDAAGQITSRDRALQSRLKFLREGVLQRLRGVPEAETALRNGKE